MEKRAQIIFQILIALSLFSLWAAFALFIINKLFYQDLPGYTIGRICIWEFIAAIVCYLISRWMINKWGNLSLNKIDSDLKISVNPKYGVYFSFYFLIALIVGVWQFWIFSQKF